MAQNTGNHLKNLAFSEEIHLLAGDHHAVLDKMKGDMLQTTKYKEMELEMDHLISRWYYKKILDTNSSPALKYVQLQDWPREYKR